MTVFNIDIVSDTVCPWCYVGKKRLERGIAEYKAKHGGGDRDDQFVVTWRPFYLNPEAGKSIDKQQYYVSKFGEERARMIFARLGAVGEGEGIKFKFGGRTGNTRDSHRLVQLAKSKSAALQTRVVEELFRAYFEDEQDITSHQVLTAAGVQAGLDRSEIEQMLSTDELGSTVDREVSLASADAISGVPHYIFQENFELSGAQEPERFVEVLERVAGMEG